MPAINGILETAVYCKDLTAARQFYGHIVGLDEISNRDGRHVFFACGDGVLLVFNPESTSTVSVPVGDQVVPKHGAEGRGHLCFNVHREELEVWEAHLVENHIEIEVKIVWREGVESIYIRDPAGNSIEFAIRQLWFAD